ncbi:Lrp/AsnC family transcriptional regulator [Thermocladium modestius]|nr:Lrp/AsnC family transcriptional regulator [Thermocladium modestius]
MRAHDASNRRELDEELLRILEEDCTLTYQEMARRVGRSLWAVRYRVEALRRSGAIKGCRAAVDYKSMGYDKVVLFFNIPPEHMREALEFMKSQSIIKSISMISGDKRFVVTMVGKSIDDIRKFIVDNLTKYKIYDAELDIVIDEIK